ncbi:MAG: phospholipase D-like domain-containing protein [Anaerolineae bacterium]
MKRGLALLAVVGAVIWLLFLLVASAGSPAATHQCQPCPSSEAPTLSVAPTAQADGEMVSAAGPELSVRKRGPAKVRAGTRLTYTIIVSNVGQLAAPQTRLTDVLPAQVDFVTHTAPYPFVWNKPDVLAWDLGTVSTATGSAPIVFRVAGLVADGAVGQLSNRITVTCAITDTDPTNNYDQALVVVEGGPESPAILVDALHYQGYETGQDDEAFRLLNLSGAPVDLGGWRVGDGESSALFPLSTTLSAGQAIWCAREATAFARQFGFQPDFEYGTGSDPVVPDMEGGAPAFADDGDECQLWDGLGNLVDALVYRGGDTQVAGWQGDALQPWSPNAKSFPVSGQILIRKREPATGLPVNDTDTLADWAQDPADHDNGRKVRYPGWDAERLFFTERVTETAHLTVAVAPDHAFAAVGALLAQAQQRIQIEAYTFRSRELADLLLARLEEGVAVTILLEGEPAFGGVTDQQRWIARQLSEAGAEILFMVNNSEADVYDRYPHLHAKMILVDGRLALIGSENLNPTGLPADAKGDGTAGHRGVLLITDAPRVVARVQAIFDADFDPAHHVDLGGCDQLPELCSPPAGFEPDWTPAWTSYTVRFTQPLVVEGELAFEVLHSPENSLRPTDGLLGLLHRAGPGDMILIEQSYELCHWGPTEGTPETDPNPRLEAYLAAARRGATVRVLLDGHYEGQVENAATVAYLQSQAQAGGLDLQARLGDPTYLGLHNKMVLASIGGRGYVHAGSINGSEVSSKANRELALQVQSEAAYDYLKTVFDYDWRIATPPVYLPLVVRGYQAPLPADHLLFSEVYYATIPAEEWVEIYNPTGRPFDLAGYKIGDAAYPDDYEGMYCFPAGAAIEPAQILVVAATATGFGPYPYQRPAFELLDTDPLVPDLTKCPAWGAGDWGLGNLGDEVLLLDGRNQAVDVVVYGAGIYPGVVAHPGGIASSHSLQRQPAWQDSDDCRVDFRDWPYPSPGSLP